MKLIQQIETVKSWSQLNSIPIFEGELPSGFPCIQWGESDKMDSLSLTAFLEFVKGLKPKFIILESAIFNYTYSPTDIKKIVESMDNEDREEYINLNKAVKIKDKEHLHFSVSFIDNGCLFKYEEWVEWVEIWNKFMELTDTYDKKKYFEDQAAKSHQVLKYAEELSKDKLFQKARNKAQRELAAKLFVKKLDFNILAYAHLQTVIDYADSINKMGISAHDL